jgi:hypothetical protein
MNQSSNISANPSTASNSVLVGDGRKIPNIKNLREQVRDSKSNLPKGPGLPKSQERRPDAKRAGVVGESECSFNLTDEDEQGRKQYKRKVSGHARSGSRKRSNSRGTSKEREHHSRDTAEDDTREA